MQSVSSRIWTRVAVSISCDDNHYTTKLLISCMLFIHFRFCLLCIKLESVRHCLWGKQHHDTIHFSRNLETACCTAYHSPLKHQYEDLVVFGYQCEDKFIFILMKTKHLVSLMVFGVVTSNGDVMLWFIFPHDLKLNTEVNIKCLKEVVTHPQSELWGWLSEDSGNRTLHCTLPHKQENPVLDVRKFLQPHHP